MPELRYTLLSDGPSDRALMHVLTWALRANGVRSPIYPEWADLRRLRNPPRGLSCRILKALDLYPCDLLFVHRDAEGAPLQTRRQEILDAVQEACASNNTQPPALCVVPVRMQEAWFLLDESAIRRAADNPHGRQQLRMPALHQIESIPDPKRVLYDLLLDASGCRGRRRNSFHVAARVYRVAEITESFEYLRNLPAFATLEQDLAEIVRQMGC